MAHANLNITITAENSEAIADLIRKKLALAWTAGARFGWERSGEGYNAEYWNERLYSGQTPWEADILPHNPFSKASD